MSCAISFSVNGRVYDVKALNGKISELYKEGKVYVEKLSKKFPRIQTHIPEDEEILKEQEALKLWATSRTDSFKRWAGDWTKVKTSLRLDRNKEPKLGEVLRFLDQHNQPELNNLQMRDLLNLINGLGFNSLSEFDAEFNKTFYPNGYFDINASSIKKSKILSRREKDSLLRDYKRIKATKEFANSYKQSYRNTLIGDNVFENKIKKSEYYDLFGGLQDINKQTSLGSKYLNPYVVEQEVGRLLAGIKTRHAFDQAVQTLPYGSITDQYNSNPKYAQRLFERFSRMPRIAVYKDVNGEFREVKMSNTEIRLGQTLISGVPIEGLKADKQTLLSIDESLYDNNPQEVSNFLKSIERKAKRMNLDVSGLAQSLETKPLNQVRRMAGGVINAMIKAGEGRMSIKDVNELSNEIDTFFNNDTDFMVQVDDLTDLKDKISRLSNRTLIHYIGSKNEVELFKEAGLIHLGNNIYQKVQKTPQSQMYEVLYNELMNDISILPKNALPSVYKNGVLNLKELLDPNNKGRIIEDLIRYVQTLKGEYTSEFSEDMATEFEQLLIHKILFDLPINAVNTSTVNDSDYKKYLHFTSSMEYMTEEFLMDFQSFMINNRGKDIYEDLLQYLDISNNGVVLKNNDPITIEELSYAIEEYIKDSRYRSMLNKLFQHSLISKNNNLYQIFEGMFDSGDVAEEGFNNREFMRVHFYNNPNNAPVVNGDYHYDSENGVLAQYGSGFDFVRMGGELFEKVSEYNGMSFYKNIPYNTNPYYNDYSVNSNDIAPIDNINYENYSSIYLNIEDNVVMKENIFGKGEMETINDRLDECM